MLRCRFGALAEQRKQPEICLELESGMNREDWGPWKFAAVAFASLAAVACMAIFSVMILRSSKASMDYEIQQKKLEAEKQLEHERIEAEKEATRPRKLWERE